MFPITPKYVQIEISNRCNLTCPLCPQGRGEVRRKNLDIDLSRFKNIIDELVQYNPKIQLWNYGEPLFHQNIVPLLKTIGNRFDYCSISTNGQVMTDILAKTIATSGITEIIFSIDGINQESYEKYRIGGSLQLVLENLKKVVKAKKTTKSDIEITIQFLILKHNFKDIPKLGAFFNKFGVDNIIAKSAMMMYEGTNKELIQMSERFLHMDYSGERYEIKNGTFEVRGIDLVYCPLIDNSITITNDGDYLVCCWDYKSELPINTNDEWKTAKKYVNSDKPPRMCNFCPIRHQNELNWDWDKVPSLEL